MKWVNRVLTIGAILGTIILVKNVVISDLLLLDKIMVCALAVYVVADQIDLALRKKHNL